MKGSKEFWQAYVRAVWPNAQTAFEEALENHSAESAAMSALYDVEGLSWNHDEVVEALKDHGIYE